MREEAGGQVGGLVMREGERGRLARESRGWRCGGCGGRTNEEILGAVGEGLEAGRGQGEETVPEGLRLAYRDEMGKRAAIPDAGSEVLGSLRPRPASPSVDATTHPDAADDGTRHDPAEPDTGAPPRGTSHHPIAPSVVPSRTATHNAPRIPRDPRRGESARAAAVPAWVDKAIVGVAVALVAMGVKKGVLGL